MTETWRDFLSEMTSALAGSGLSLGTDRVSVVGAGEPPSFYPVSDLAAAAFGAAGLALAAATGSAGAVRVDRRLASLWYDKTLVPEGWSAPPLWAPVSGDYPTADGWLRIHANAETHRRAALRALFGDEQADPKGVAGAVAGWEALALETAIVEAGGAAARMRDASSWAASAPGAAIAAEPLIAWSAWPSVASDAGSTPGAALAGLRVLDLTRVLAGPAATRFLALYGASVLRIDPPFWDEPGVVPEMTLGKRCAGLDLRRDADRAIFERLVGEADLLIHGYRNGALAGLGYDGARLRALNPRLIDVALNAYGWTGPWAKRRGFDSLVQMSCGIAAHGMARSGAARPTPLPVQALDHATGYLIAAAALAALAARRRTGAVFSARLSLARTALMFGGQARDQSHGAPLTIETRDLAAWREETAWGPAHRLRPAVEIADRPAIQPRAATSLRSAPPSWD